jgi:hypothetical protein
MSQHPQAGEWLALVNYCLVEAEKHQLTCTLQWYGTWIDSAVPENSVEGPIGTSLGGAITEARLSALPPAPLWQHLLQRWQIKRFMATLKTSPRLKHLVTHGSVRHQLRRFGVQNEAIAMPNYPLNLINLQQASPLVKPSHLWHTLKQRLHPSTSSIPAEAIVTFAVVGPIAPQIQSLERLCYSLAELPNRFKLILLGGNEGTTEEARLVQLIQSLHLNERITLVGLPHEETLHTILPFVDIGLILPFDDMMIQPEALKAWWQSCASLVKYCWLYTPSVEGEASVSLTNPLPYWLLEQHKALHAISNQHLFRLHTLSAVSMLLLERQQQHIAQAATRPDSSFIDGTTVPSLVSV